MALWVLKGHLVLELKIRIVTKALLAAGKEEHEHAVKNNKFSVPVCTVMVDGVKGFISTPILQRVWYLKPIVKKLLYIDVHIKYCYTVLLLNGAIALSHNINAIILQSFKCFGRMHELRYIWMISDADSLGYSSICIGVPIRQVSA